MWSSIKNWFKKLIKKNPEGGITSPPKPVENPDQEQPTTVNGGLKIALIRGHGGKDSGAEGCGTNEVEYNTWVMDYVSSKTKRNVKLFMGDSSMIAVGKSFAWMPDVSIQLHLNSFNGTANGCEVLVVKGDVKSYPLAESFAKKFTQEFGRTMRRPESKGKKLLESGDRGFASMKASALGAKILVEPFFIDNKNDFVPKEDYAKFLVEFIDSI